MYQSTSRIYSVITHPLSVHNVKAVLTATDAVHRNSIGFLFIVSSSSTNTLFAVFVVLSRKELDAVMKGVAHPLLDLLVLKLLNESY